MAVARPDRPRLASRIARAIVGDRSRVLYPLHDEAGNITALEHHGVDLLGQAFEASDARRAQRGPAQLTTSHAAVYAAIRWRERAVARPPIRAQRRVGSEWVDLETHPALEALRHVNEGLTERQGRALVERQKLTYGEGFWVKRRDRLGVVREFEIWNPALVRPVPFKDRPWAVEKFEYHQADGSVTVVPASEVVWFRHAVHPGNPLVSLSPIAAVRITIDTTFDAMRHNQRYFDLGIAAGGTVSGPDIGPGEADRIRQELRGEWAGVDNSHRWHVIEGEDLKVTPLMVSNHDMQWAELMNWGVEETARAFELSPLALKDFRRATYQNADQAEASDWDTASSSLDDTLATYNEQCVQRDFGPDFRIVADYSDIAALQDDLKRRAEIDEIELRTGKVTINELRDRDGEDAVPWGDEPLIAQNVRPLSYEPPAPTPPTLPGAAGPGAPGEPPAEVEADDPPARLFTRAAGREHERDLERTWSRVFRDELRRLLAFLEERDTPDARSGRHVRVDSGDVDAYDWNWIERHGDTIARDLADAFNAVLVAEGFQETPLMTARQYATSWARREAGELLSLEGSRSTVRTTRAAVRRVVAQTLEEGQSFRELKNRLRALYEFSPSRAETIARTEMATAVGQGAQSAARSQGRDQKRWRTARDERVDGGNPSGPCNDNARAGWIDIDATFPSGDDTLPAHPRCRCDVEYRTRRLQPEGRQ